MFDIQSENDYRGIPLNRVGVKNIKYPVMILEKLGSMQPSIACIDLLVDLDEDKRGTHMSRLVEALHNWNSEVSYDSIRYLLLKIKEVAESKKAFIEMEFPFFIKKSSPVTNNIGIVDYKCTISANIDDDNNYGLLLKVGVPITSVCPCSKAISDNGAHNQRGEVCITVEAKEKIYIEEIVEIAEKSGSCEIFSVLKRPDEKYVTEKSFNNSKFVEDILRDVVIELNNNNNIIWFDVTVENFESIHNHNAFARVTK